MESATTRRLLEVQPVDEETVALEKYLELEQRKPAAQAVQFAERFVFILETVGLRAVFDIQADFELALRQHWSSSEAGSGGGRGSVTSSIGFSPGDVGEDELAAHNYLPLNSTPFSKFLEKMDKPMPQLHRKYAFTGLCKQDDSGITLLGYLLYHFRRKILVQYFHRRQRKTPKGVVGKPAGHDLGNQKVGFEMTLRNNRKTLAFALKEEMFTRLPFGIDPVLDAGLYQFVEFVTPMRRAILQLLDASENENLSIVQRNASKSELSTLKGEYAQAFEVSYSKMRSYIDKLKKKQRTTFLEMRKASSAQARTRQMTLERK